MLGISSTSPIAFLKGGLWNRRSQKSEVATCSKHHVDHRSAVASTLPQRAPKEVNHGIDLFSSRQRDDWKKDQGPLWSDPLQKKTLTESELGKSQLTSNRAKCQQLLLNPSVGAVQDTIFPRALLFVLVPENATSGSVQSWYQKGPAFRLRRH